MIANFDLSQLFTFPVQDENARKNFIIASLVYLAGFIIPILPLIVIMGYTARIMRQVINSEAPRMPAWDDFESMFKDGLYLFGLRIIYMLPLFIIFFPLFFGMMSLPVFLETNHGASDQIAVFMPILFGSFMLIALPLSLVIGILLPAAETHMIANNDFAAGFRFKEWWPVFRTNWAGFLVAFLISYLVSMVLSALVGFAVITIVLICLLPFLMPAVYAYITVVMYTAFAQAYKEGKDRLIVNHLPVVPPQ